MDKQEQVNRQVVLENAIYKAAQNGWVIPWGDGKWYPQEFSINDIIFDHQFAKALWGEEKLSKAASQLSDVNTDYLWQLRLQQMVISEDPILYLADNK